MLVVGRIAIRLALWGLGCAAILWSVSLFGQLPDSTVVEDAATRIVSGDVFPQSEIGALLAAVEVVEAADYCQPSALRAAAIIRLELLEDAILDGDRDHIDSYMRRSRATTLQALSCVPNDSMLWLALYRVKTLQEGFKPEDLAFLQASYQFGPNEGWIALKRNWLALSVYPQLSPALQEAAVAEFAKILDMGAYGIAATIFEGPGWKVHNLLLASLKDVSERNRHSFYNVIFHDGFNLPVPGIPRREPRPWD